MGFADPGISFDRFVRACVVIKQLSDAFIRLDTDKDGWIQINYEQFMHTVLTLPWGLGFVVLLWERSCVLGICKLCMRDKIRTSFERQISSRPNFMASQVPIYVSALIKVGLEKKCSLWGFHSFSLKLKWFAFMIVSNKSASHGWRQNPCFMFYSTGFLTFSLKTKAATTDFNSEWVKTASSWVWSWRLVHRVRVSRWVFLFTCTLIGCLILLSGSSRGWLHYFLSNFGSTSTSGTARTDRRDPTESFRPSASV